jgi:hypothetical protein
MERMAAEYCLTSKASAAILESALLPGAKQFGDGQGIDRPSNLGNPHMNTDAPVFRSGPCWKITSPTNVSTFLAALPLLQIEEATFYLESGATAPEQLDSYLKERAVPTAVKIPGGTIVPRPVIYQILLTPNSLAGLATLVEELEVATGSFHIHIYRGRDILLSWFDAFLDPIFLSGQIPKERVDEFSKGIGCTYEQIN